MSASAASRRNLAQRNQEGPVRDILSRTAATNLGISPSRMRRRSRPPPITSSSRTASIPSSRNSTLNAPHQGLAMACPATVYTPSPRPFSGCPDIDYPFHDHDALITACGRLCMHRKKINVSTVLAGQRVRLRKVDDGIWLVSFMQYDFGGDDLEARTLQTGENPFGTKEGAVRPMLTSVLLHN